MRDSATGTCQPCGADLAPTRCCSLIQAASAGRELASPAAMATKCQHCACHTAFLAWARGAGAVPPPAIPAGVSLPATLSPVLLSGSCWCQPN